MEYPVPRRLHRVVTKKNAYRSLVAETEGKNFLGYDASMWELIICDAPCRVTFFSTHCRDAGYSLLVLILETS